MDTNETVQALKSRTDQTLKTLAEELDAAREAKGLTVLELAEESGIARTTLQRRLAGVSDFTIPELYRVCAAVGLVPAVVVAKVAA